MLVEFKISNYRSFWKPQTLTLVAGPVKELQKTNTFEPPLKGFPRLLRSAVLYGPNGSGKSNLINGLAFMQTLVLSSSRESQEGENINRHPFLLNTEGTILPGEFEVTFIQEAVRYQYGFKVMDTRVVHEWLLAYPENRPQRWFERIYDPQKQEEAWYFGTKFAGPKKTWKQATRPNALFLSTAVQLNNEQLKPVYGWFQKMVVIGHGVELDRSFTIKHCKNEETRTKVLSFLKKADIDVEGIEVREKELPLPSGIQKKFLDAPGPVKIFLKQATLIEVFFKHKLKDSGTTIPFPLSIESDGTQKLFAYAAPWMDTLDTGRVLVIDELDNSFHPHIVRFLLGLFHHSESNPKNGQLVFSTHDTSILDRDVVRRDQIWLMEKNQEQATHLYSLSDFHPRKNEAIGKGYLQGRYGALPYIGEVSF
ncbi:AAA family ATPase [Desulfosarcina sp. OttesenSCG-928-A07]|nr:AAA family ATPase [Desulfosarcina sp. OttesenSCG-928-G17]MDL2329570.1 AAA family ATPase [Desulfosarcina sp. OttesenSCG-928-A07]